MTRRQHLAVDVTFAFVVRAFGAVASLLMNLAVARTLGETQAGYFFLALTTVVVASSMTRIGLDSTVVRFVSSHAADGDWGAVQQTIARALLWTAIASSLVAATLFLAAPAIAETAFSKPALGAVLRTIAPAIVLVALANIFAFALQGLRATRSSITVESILPQVGMAAGCVVLSITSAVAAAEAYDVATLVALLLGFYWWRRSSRSGTGRAHSEALLASCLPLSIAMFMTLAVQWSGQFAAGAYLRPEDIAHLAVAQRIALLVNFVLVAVNLVVAPQFAMLYQHGKLEELRTIALSSVRWMLFFSTPIVLLLLIFPAWLLHWFGEGFENGANMLRWLALGQFINVCTGSVGTLLAMSGHERDLRNVRLISGPVAIACAFGLTPIFGPVGAAAGTAIALAIDNLLAVYLVKRRLGFSTLRFWYA